MPELRRSTLLFSQDQIAESLYLVESGLVKLTRTSPAGGRIILAIRGAGDLLGEETLGGDSEQYTSEAEVISGATVYRIPKADLHRLVTKHPELANALLSYLIANRNGLAEKVEMLCLHDVEYRVLHYVGKLCSVVSKGVDGAGYQIPITQLELADLIGATRETTSTVLNQLERRGLLHLSRRMLTIDSLEGIKGALQQVHEAPAPPREESALLGSAPA